MSCGNQQNADQRKRKIEFQAVFRRGRVKVIAEREDRMAAINEHSTERVDKQRHERDGCRMGQEHQKIDQSETEYAAEQQAEKRKQRYPRNRVHDYIERRRQNSKQQIK